MARRRSPKLVTQYLEDISREALETHTDVVRAFVGRRTGIYALYRRGKLYYSGLASNLVSRLKTHLRDKHRDSWDSFSVYLTIGDQHMSELESLVLRMVAPPGNTQLGRFRGAEDLLRKFRRAIATKQKSQLDELLLRKQEAESPDTLITKTLHIRARHKGKLIRARLRKDGQVRVNGKLYSSLSAAAGAVTGRPANGWHFWTYRRGPGEWVRVSALRD